MEKKVVFQNDKERFLSHSVLFVKEFETPFANYFTHLCSTYDNVDNEDAKEMALSIYKWLFGYNYCNEKIKNDLFVQMQKNGVMICFLINRSMFYLIEQYIIFSREHTLIPEVELLMSRISHFINCVESEMSLEVQHHKKTLDVSFSDDVMFSPTNNIIETFQKMQEENEKVVFLNLYKGVPISSESSIVDIDGEQITFRIDRLQEIAMKLDGQAFIVKNERFGKHLKADIVYSNFQTKTVVLTNFIYLLNMPALQREFVRVHPDVIAKVHVHQFGSSQETSGRLYDISLNGLGVVTNENNGIFVGGKVLVEFELNHNGNSSMSDRKIELQGEVVNIIEYKDSFRFCMKIFPDVTMSEKISHYITQREHEILLNLNNELKEYII